MGSRLRKIGALHSVFDIARNFLDMIPTIEDQLIQEVYYKLFKLFCYTMMEEYAAAFTSSNTLLPAHFNVIQELKEQIYEYLTPHALKLAEGIQFDDNLLTSAIAHSNEKPYENLYEWSKKYAVLNRHGDIHPSVQKHLVPYVQEQERKLGIEQRRVRDKL